MEETEKKTAKVAVGETETNAFYIKIVKCCASCRYKEYDAANRICLKGEGVVKPHYVCTDWELITGANRAREGKRANGVFDLSVAGKGTGRVKRKAYFDFLVREQDRAKARNEYPMAVGEMRKRWEKTHGSVFERGL